MHAQHRTNCAVYIKWLTHSFQNPIAYSLSITLSSISFSPRHFYLSPVYLQFAGRTIYDLPNWTVSWIVNRDIIRLIELNKSEIKWIFHKIRNFYSCPATYYIWSIWSPVRLRLYVSGSFLSGPEVIYNIDANIRGDRQINTEFDSSRWSFSRISITNTTNMHLECYQRTFLLKGRFQICCCKIDSQC